MIIRRAPDAFGLDPGVDGPGKISVFHQSPGFTGIVLEVFSFPGGLHPAFIHLEDEAVFAFFNKRLGVDSGIKPEIEGCLQTGKAGLVGKIQELLDGFGFKR